MILFCDENVGTGVPHGLWGVGLEARALVDHGWRGRPDEWWLRRVATLGWLVFSYNLRMLKVQKERDVIIEEGVGIVFLTTGQARSANVLQLLLRRWPDLELLDATVPRPFARFLSPNGRIREKFRDYHL